jgi:predicted PurR-regulated permease PerM
MEAAQRTPQKTYAATPTLKTGCEPMIRLYEMRETRNYLLAAAILLILIIGMQITAYIVNLLVISLILTILTLPTMDFLRKKGIPDGIAVGVITVVAGGVILGTLMLTMHSFQVLIQDLPMYQAELNDRLSELLLLLDKIGIDPASLSPSSISLSSIVAIIEPYALNAGNGVLYLFFIMITTCFALLEAPKLPERLEKILGANLEGRFGIKRMSSLMIEFVIVRTEANLIHGTLFGLSLWAMGIHAAALWGILTFILAFIPYIGLFIAAIPAIFFAWLQYGVWGAVAVVIIVVILNALVENPIFAYIASRRFDLPPLVVIISLIVWGWILGISGMIFAIPITLILLIMVQCSDETRWINTLLGVDKLFADEGGAKEKH